MAKVRLTEDKVAKAVFATYGQFTTDEEVRHLLLRITPNNSKSYVVKWTPKDGRPRQHRTLGPVDEWTLDRAREEARRLVVEDAPPQRDNLTLTKLYAIWEESYSAGYGKAPVANFRSAWKNSIGKDEIAILKLSAVNVAEVTGFYGRQRKRYAIATANRHLSYVSKLFEIAQENGWTTKGNPTKGIKREAPNKRVGSFTDDDMTTLSKNLKALKSRFPQGVAGLEFAMLYPLRGAEIRAMRWEHLEFDANGETGSLLVPPLSYKTRKAKKFPLNKIHTDYLKSLPRWSDEWVFPSPRDPKSPLAKDYWRDMWKRARPNSHGAHFLRKTGATNMLNSGFPIEIVSRILGHTNVRTTAEAYAFLNVATIRQYLDSYVASLPEEDEAEAEEMRKTLAFAKAQREEEELRTLEKAELSAHPDWVATPKKAPAGLG